MATAVEGRESLDPLFAPGFLAIIAGYLTLTVVDVRGRLVPARGGLVLLAGFVASVLVDSIGAGGLVLAASWAALSRLIATPEASASHERRSPRITESAS